MKAELPPGGYSSRGVPNDLPGLEGKSTKKKIEKWKRSVHEREDWGGEIEQDWAQGAGFASHDVLSIAVTEPKRRVLRVILPDKMGNLAR